MGGGGVQLFANIIFTDMLFHFYKYFFAKQGKYLEMLLYTARSLFYSHDCLRGFNREFSIFFNIEKLLFCFIKLYKCAHK